MIAAFPGGRERRAIEALRHPKIRLRVNQGFERGLMRRPAIAAHDCLDDRRPMEIVEVGERSVWDGQTPHDPPMTEVGCCDERRAVVTTFDQPRACAQCKQRLQRGLVVCDCGKGHGIGAVAL
ncbi:MAG: hypothetical protein RMK02_01310 [Burkholderiales bacterium]|nr:hypothetical protein [Burkholderiales bacterium]